MGLPQVVHQQFGGPDRGLITQLAWILSECRLDQGVDDPARSREGGPSVGRRGGVPGRSSPSRWRNRSAQLVYGSDG